MEWLAEERRKHDDLQREKWRHVEEHMRLTSGYQEAMQGTAHVPLTLTCRVDLFYSMPYSELYNKSTTSLHVKMLYGLQYKKAN